MGDHLWRVSVAEISSPGHFSAFPGVDRTILLLRGDGIVLTSPAWPDHSLSVPLQPFRFRGEDSVHARLLGGPTENLNIMVQRGRAACTVYAGSSAMLEISPGCDDLIVIAVRGRVRILVPDAPAVELDEQCFLRISAVDSLLTLAPSTDDASSLCIRIRRFA